MTENLTTSEIDPDDDGGGYIRGGGGVIDTRRLFRVVVGSAVVALVALVSVLTIGAVNSNSRIDSLRQRGVPVDATVTSCLGILSGTGITVTSFQCNGSFSLDGRSYNAVIAGSNVNHSPGDVVMAVADPKNPTTLSTAGWVATARSSWRPFIAPGILFVVLVSLVLGVLWWPRRASAQRPPDGDALG